MAWFKKPAPPEPKAPTPPVREVPPPAPVLTEAVGVAVGRKAGRGKLLEEAMAAEIRKIDRECEEVWGSGLPTEEAQSIIELKRAPEEMKRRMLAAKEAAKRGL